MIVWCHGDKGGVGKSIVASLILNHLLIEQRPCALIEGDRSVPDVAYRFQGAMDRIFAVALNRAGDAETSLVEFGNILEQNTTSADVVVINMPAGAGETLDQFAIVLANIASATGHEFVVTYSLGSSAIAAESFAESMKRGLLSVAERAVAIRPLFIAKENSFAWANHESRSAFINKFGEASDVSLPELRSDFLRDKALRIAAPFSSIAADPARGLSLSERVLFSQWVKNCEAVIHAVLGSAENTTVTSIKKMAKNK